MLFAGCDLWLLGQRGRHRLLKKCLLVVQFLLRGIYVQMHHERLWNVDRLTEENGALYSSPAHT